MADLKTREETFFVVDYEDLGSFIEQVYSKGFDFVADQETSNDSSHTFYSIKKKALGSYETENVEKFKKTGIHAFLTNSLLTDLCNKDLIKEGNYIITVCW